MNWIEYFILKYINFRRRKLALLLCIYDYLSYFPGLFYYLVFLPKHLLGFSPQVIEIENNEFIRIFPEKAVVPLRVLVFGWSYSDIIRGSSGRLVSVPFLWKTHRYDLFIDTEEEKYGFSPEKMHEKVIFDQIKIFPENICIE
jgi:hypothetical protein